MRGLIMDRQLTVGAIARRAEALAAGRSVVTRRGDGTVRRGSWGDTVARARRLAVALGGLGVQRGDRVATLCWNQQEHLDAYFGVPMLGAVLHTLNARLEADELAAVLDSAGSRVLIVDETLVERFEAVRARARVEHVIVAGDPCPRGDLRGYDDLLAAADGDAFVEPSIDERDACALCFTTGTTGRPKGVLYSHRAVALQALANMTVDFGGVSASDTILLIVPMFHGNAWNWPFAAALAGAALVLPHSDLRARTILETIAGERVTMTGGVPTIWHDVLVTLDAGRGEFDLSSLRVVRIGGAPLSEALRMGLEERHGIPVLAGFGMTELTATGCLPAKRAPESKGVRPLPFLEVRARAQGKPVPRDGESLGELEFRGPTVASSYWNGDGSGTVTDDGWLRSGDIGTIDAQGAIEIRDRSKDMIKSGGEWISSVALEQALASHPAIADAAVIPVPHDRWQERPLAVVATHPGLSITDDDLRAHLEGQVPRWWVPERFEFVTEVPRTSVGKLAKQELRTRFSSA